MEDVRVRYKIMNINKLTYTDVYLHTNKHNYLRYMFLHTHTLTNVHTHTHYTPIYIHTKITHTHTHQNPKYQAEAIHMSRRNIKIPFLYKIPTGFVIKKEKKKIKETCGFRG